MNQGSLLKRGISAVSWNVAANVSKISISVVRSILLARWLEVETFGIYALAGSLVGLSIVIPNFGLLGAFLHRAEETRDEEAAISVLFTMRTLFLLIWAGLISAGTLLLAEGELRTTLLAMVVLVGGLHLVDTPKFILMRRVTHERLAVLQFSIALFAAAVSLILAYQGYELIALLATDLLATLLTFTLLFLWRPIWKPRFLWKPEIVRYYLNFGARNLLANVLEQALDRIDDIWTGVFLGQTALGYYGRAYTFATYPRQLLSAPLNNVIGGAYAELSDDRVRLSQAFFRTNALIIRSSFLLGGLILLCAPEFIRIVLGEKWLPMLDIFRLMLFFTLLDPVRRTVSELLIATGKPGKIARVRALQLVILLVGLFVGGFLWGAEGVAVAVNLMLTFGILALMREARSSVDFQTWRLLGVPILGFVAGVILGRASLTFLEGPMSDWQTGTVKGSVFLIVYTVILLVLEREQLKEILVLVKAFVTERQGALQQAGSDDDEVV